CHPRADRDDTSLRYNAPLDTLQLNPTPFRRTAPVVRDRRHVNDVTDLVPERVQRAHGRFTARTGTLDAHFQAANAVLLREPLKPAPPQVAQDNTLPWRSLIDTIVLLKDAWICTTPSDTLFLTFFLALGAAAVSGVSAITFP